MVTKTSKTEIKRSSKGMRLHVRRMKQAARKEVGTNNPQTKSTQPPRVHKKQDQSE